MAKRLAAAGGFVVSVFWNVEQDNAFTVAEDGLLITQFDMRDPGLRWGREPDRYPLLLENFDRDDWMVSGLALAETLTGLRLPESWTSLQGLGVRVVSPRQDLVPDHYWNHRILREPELASILSDPRPEHLPLIARIAAETAVRHTSLTGEAVTATLAWLQRRDGEDERARLQIEMARLSEEIRQRSFEALAAEGRTSSDGSLSRLLFFRANAAWALSEALESDVTEAAYNSVSRASLLGLAEDDGLRLVILQRCAHRIRWG